jgi:DNA polymerase III epsilon subunit-like protein
VPSPEYHQDTNLLTLNQAMLAVIDIMTTGSNPKQDSMVQICILPLNSEIKPHKGILPYYVDLIPKRPESIDWENLPRYITRDTIFKCMNRGVDPYIAADRFELWFEKIKLKHGKKLHILTHDWIDKQAFLKDWLCLSSYYDIFDYRYRDLVSAALFANDLADFHCTQIPYPKQNLAFLCSELKVEHERSMKDTLQNCISIAEIYRRMLRR